MACYKEPLDLIMATLDTVKAQTEVDLINLGVPVSSSDLWTGLKAARLFVVVGLEEGTPEKEAKRTAIMTRYQGCFYGLLVTVHPKGVPGSFVAQLLKAEGKRG